MVRTLTVVIGMAMSLMARNASAIPIQLTPVDLDSRAGGSLVRSHTALFKTEPPTPPFTTGEISSDVFFDGFDEYTYVLRVVPYVNVYFGDLNATGGFGPFGSPAGFNGIAGWSFSDALRAGGTGTDSDFSIFWSVDPGNNFFGWSDRLGWWDPFEPIQFFFVSGITRSCPSFDPHCSVGIGLYSHSSRDFGGGRAPGLSPVPEPGSIALFGSGLMGIYAAICRRRNAKT